MNEIEIIALIFINFVKKKQIFSITVKPILTWIANIIYHGLFVFSELRWQVIIHFLYIGGIVDHHCLYFFFIIITHEANHIIFLSQVTDKLYHIMLYLLPSLYVAAFVRRTTSSSDLHPLSKRSLYFLWMLSHYIIYFIRDVV